MSECAGKCKKHTKPNGYRVPESCFCRRCNTWMEITHRRCPCCLGPLRRHKKFRVRKVDIEIENYPEKIVKILD